MTLSTPWYSPNPSATPTRTRSLITHTQARRASIGAWILLCCLACPPPDLQADPKPSAEPIDEARYVTIGGIEQWITIKGDNRSKPVILFLHGGPGNPMSVWSEALYRDWEDDFTLVQWDQRCAGKTYARNEPIEELTIERFHATRLTVDQMVQDGIELAAFLCGHLDQDKIILTGTSWGSVLGLHMARARPGLFHAYVGVSQIVDHGKMMEASYQLTLARARTTNDSEAVAQLESLGPPPWENPRHFGHLRRIIRRYEGARTSPAPELIAGPVYDSDEYRAAYTAGEDLSFLKFVGLKNDGMASTIDSEKVGHSFEIPIFLIQGSEDLLTVPAITEAWFNRIEAPMKELIHAPAAGHDPNLAMIETHFEVLTRCVASQIASPQDRPMRESEPTGLH